MRYYLKLKRDNSQEEINVLLESTDSIKIDLDPILNSLKLNLSDTDVVPGEYTNPVFVVNQQGRITKIIEGTDLQAQIDDIKFELKSNSPAKYKEFIYTGDDLTTINIWSDNTMTTKLYQVDFTYSVGDLTQKEVTRISDSFVYTTVYTYSLGKLINTETT